MFPPKLILCNTQSLADGDQVLFKMADEPKYWLAGTWDDYSGTDGGVLMDKDILIEAEELPSHVFRIVH